MRRGFANLPLHGGRAPRWLFARMKKMAGAVAQVICEEFGPDELLVRLSDPAWFQAFGCVLGFDWHSSGVTTTVCGALKEGVRPFGESVGLFVGGGKDGHPYPVNREVYDQSIDFLRKSIDQAKLGQSEKRDALRQLARFLARRPSSASEALRTQRRQDDQ